MHALGFSSLSIVILETCSMFRYVIKESGIMFEIVFDDFCFSIRMCSKLTLDVLELTSLIPQHFLQVFRILFDGLLLYFEHS